MQFFYFLQLTSGRKSWNGIHVNTTESSAIYLVSKLYPKRRDICLKLNLPSSRLDFEPCCFLTTVSMFSCYSKGSFFQSLQFVNATQQLIRPLFFQCLVVFFFQRQIRGLKSHRAVGSNPTSFKRLSTSSCSSCCFFTLGGGTEGDDDVAVVRRGVTGVVLFRFLALLIIDLETGNIFFFVAVV